MSSVVISPPLPHERPQLVVIWEAAVRATHHFLQESDIQLLKPLLETQYFPQVELFCARNDQGEISGFMGLAGKQVEMLFVAPEQHGRGIGKALMQHAVARGADTVDVNEQNPAALGFYQKLGFTIVDRSPLDGAGRPFPILHLQLADTTRE